jgi:hypothetical protein
VVAVARSWLLVTFRIEKRYDVLEEYICCCRSLNTRLVCPPGLLPPRLLVPDRPRLLHIRHLRRALEQHTSILNAHDAWVFSNELKFTSLARVFQDVAEDLRSEGSPVSREMRPRAS